MKGWIKHFSDLFNPHMLRNSMEEGYMLSELNNLEKQKILYLMN